jgi:general stress protein YciG
MNEKRGRSNRGFASMDVAKQREIASKGGKAAHEKGTAHEFTSEEAAAAGRKGGKLDSQKTRSQSKRNRQPKRMNSGGGEGRSRLERPEESKS